MSSDSGGGGGGGGGGESTQNGNNKVNWRKTQSIVGCVLLSIYTIVMLSVRLHREHLGGGSDTVIINGGNVIYSTLDQELEESNDLVLDPEMFLEEENGEASDHKTVMGLRATSSVVTDADPAIPSGLSENINDEQQQDDNQVEKKLPINLCNEERMAHLTLSNGGSCIVARSSIPALYDHRQDVVEHYQNELMEQVRAHDRIGTDLPLVRRLYSDKPLTFVIWSSTHSNSYASAYVEDDDKTHVIQGPGWLDPSNPQHAMILQNYTNEQLPVMELKDGKQYVAFTTWFNGYFGHYFDDHLPVIAYLRSQVSHETKFLLLDTPLGREALRFLDPDFYDRVVWVQERQPVRIDNSHAQNKNNSLHVSVPLPGYPLMWGCQRPYDYLRSWIGQHRLPKVPKKRHVVFYSRRVEGLGIHHGRVLDKQQEDWMLEQIKQAMKEYKRPEKDLIVFNGYYPLAEGETTPRPMSIEEQHDVFRSALTIIGPHGAGMLGNLVWVDPQPGSCANRVKLLEFIPGPDSAHIQPMYHSVHMRWRHWPVDFHTILYTAASTQQTTFVDPDDFRAALEGMWGTPSASTLDYPNLHPERIQKS